MSRSPPPSALSKRSADQASSKLMLPPTQPPSKRIKRPPKVLPEETYESTLSHIIARDFYPGLLETEAQQEYLDALQSHDSDWIKDAGRRLETAMTPVADGKRRGKRGVSMAAATPLVGRGTTSEDTPKTWDTALSTPRTVTGIGDQGQGEKAEKERREDEARRRMSLAAFQAKYTSEDNESFNKLLDKQNERRAQKYAWLWDGNRLPSKQRIAQAKVAEDKRVQGQIDEHSLGISDDLRARQALPDIAPCPPRNALMFMPEGVEETTTASGPSMGHAGKDKAVAQTISFQSTRMPNSEQPRDRTSRASSPSQSEIAEAIAGRVRPTASESGIAGPSETPRVNGYTFVDAEPTKSELALAEQGNPHEKDSASTLFSRLTAEAAKSGGARFSISDASSREKLHYRMVDRTAAMKRGDGLATPRRPGKGTSDTPRFTSFPKTPVASSATRADGVVAGALTPAAKRLLDKVGGTPTRKTGMGSGFGQSEKTRREWWTPNATPRAKGR